MQHSNYLGFLNNSEEVFDGAHTLVVGGANALRKI